MKELEIILDEKPQEYPLKSNMLMDKKQLKHIKIEIFFTEILDFIKTNINNTQTNEKEIFNIICKQTNENFFTLTDFLYNKYLLFNGDDKNNSNNPNEDKISNDLKKNYKATETINDKQFFFVFEKFNDTNKFYLDVYEEIKEPVKKYTIQTKDVLKGGLVSLIIFLWFKKYHKNDNKNPLITDKLLSNQRSFSKQKVIREYR